VDPSGTVFVADEFNARIRRVDGATGIITTVAGTGTTGGCGDGQAATTAQLAHPTGVAVDGSGNLFIADRNNERIRRVDSATGIITTVAGTAAAGFCGDGGLATMAQLLSPWGVTVDGTANLFIADFDNQHIRRVDHDMGIITTLASRATGPVFSSNPIAVALDRNGDLFVTSSGNRVIERVEAPLGAGVVGTECAAEADGCAGSCPDSGCGTTTTTTIPTQAPACSEAPLDGCRQPTRRGAARLRLVAGARHRPTSVSWSWGKGAATARGDWGDPRKTTDYALCVYDVTSSLRMRLRADAGGTCRKKPCWKATRRGYEYVGTTHAPDGVEELALESGGQGKARIVLTAKGVGVPLPSLVGLLAPVRVQLQGNGRCWEADFSTDRAPASGIFAARSS
jgi:hypothetical protein